MNKATKDYSVKRRLPRTTTAPEFRELYGDHAGEILKACTADADPSK